MTIPSDPTRIREQAKAITSTISDPSYTKSHGLIQWSYRQAYSSFTDIIKGLGT